MRIERCRRRGVEDVGAAEQSMRRGMSLVSIASRRGCPGGAAARAATLRRSRQNRTRRSAMHAVVITVGIEPGKADEATAILHNQVVPDVKATPGFVSGTWARSEDGTNGHSLVLFENEETAKAALAQ